MKLRSLFLLSLLLALPLSSYCQEGYYSFPMELSLEDAQEIKKVVWDGQKSGKFLCFNDYRLTYAYTYDDLSRIYDRRHSDPTPTTTVRVSVYWSGNKDYLHAFAIAPVYSDSDEIVYYCLSDISESFEEDFRDQLFQTIDENLLTHINDQYGTSNLTQLEDQTVQKLDLNNTRDLYIAPLDRLPQELLAGLKAGKYIAFPSPKLERVFKRRNSKKTWQSISDFNSEDIESLLVFASWSKVDTPIVEEAPYCMTTGPIQRIRKLEELGLLLSDGRIVYFIWADVRKHLGETGAWVQEEPLSSKPSEEEIEQANQIGKAAIYRMYFRSAFAEKMEVEFIR